MLMEYFPDRPLRCLLMANLCVRSTYRMVMPSSWRKSWDCASLSSQVGQPRQYVNAIKDSAWKIFICAVKLTTYHAFLANYGLQDEEVIYVGDDVPDYEIMKCCGCPCCPADACSDIKRIATYVSSRKGGEGVGRDVIEQVLRAQNLWLADAKAFGW